MDTRTDELEALGVQIREALARRDLNAFEVLLAKRTAVALQLFKQRRRAARAERRARRAERRQRRFEREARREEREAQRAAWPKCGAPRSDGAPCCARTLWVKGEESPRTRCHRHGGRESPNVPRIRPTKGAE